MTKVAVIAHAGKSIGGGLEELRSTLERAGVERAALVGGAEEQVRAGARRAGARGRRRARLRLGRRRDGAALDRRARGQRRHARDHPGRHGEPLRLEPRDPVDIEEAVEIGLNGRDRKLDVGKINGERFAVMAGAGLDAHMIREADGGLKDRFGRARVRLDGVEEPPRGALQGADRRQRRALVQGQRELCAARQRRLAVRRDRGVRQRASPTTGCSRSASRAPTASASGHGPWPGRRSARPRKSPFVQVTKAKKIRIELDRKVDYELDGGARGKTKMLKAKVEPGAITVRVPELQ